MAKEVLENKRESVKSVESDIDKCQQELKQMEKDKEVLKLAYYRKFSFSWNRV